MNVRAISAIAAAATLSLAGGVATADDWPQWRGAARDGHASTSRAVNSLPAEPKVIWRMEIGGGFSSPVVVQGKMVYLDAQNQKEVAHCLDARTGKELWNVPFAAMFQDEWGPGPRCTPIIDGDRVYVQSCDGELRCLSLGDGKAIWGVGFEKDFGVKFLGAKQSEGVASRRGNNGSGVIDDNRLIVPVGCVQGASLVCFDKMSGKVLWKTGDDEASYSSLVVATLAGTRVVLHFNADALVGVELETGRLMWRVPLRTDARRHAATPVVFGDTVTVNSHTIGTVCLKIEKDGAGQKVERLWSDRELKTNLATPVLVDHFFYNQGAGKDYFCVDALTGKQMWLQGGFGERYDPTIVVGKNLLVQTDSGDLVLLAADPAKYTELGRVQVCGKTWSHPAYADGRLYVREGVDRGWKLTCYQLVP